MPIANTAMEEWAKGSRDRPRPLKPNPNGDPLCASE